MSWIYSPSPWIQTVKQPTLSSVSLLSAFPHRVALHPRYFPTDLTPMPPPLPPFNPPLPGEGESRSSLRFRLQGQHPLALPTLLLVSGPVPLLALGAAVARHLTATADVELPELQEHTVRFGLQTRTLFEIQQIWTKICSWIALQIFTS